MKSTKSAYIEGNAFSTTKSASGLRFEIPKTHARLVETSLLRTRKCGPMRGFARSAVSEQRAVLYRREKTAVTSMTATSLLAVCLIGLLRLTSGQPHPDPGPELKTPWPEPKPAFPKQGPERYPPHTSHPWMNRMVPHRNALTRADTRQGGVRMRRSAATGRGLSQTEKTHLLNVHNNFRRQSGATAMNKLYWNDDLASYAQTWADGCNFNHGQPPGAPNNIGQNLYASTHRPVNLTYAPQRWYDEIQYYNLATLDCQDGIDPITGNPIVCGHYTAMVWATTRELGCGYYRCPSLTGEEDADNANYVVCNYNPAGNFVGRPPFVRGTACSGCTSNVCDNGLCDWRRCSSCRVSDYNCTACSLSNGDPTSRCTASVQGLIASPSKGSTVRHVQVRLTSPSALFTSGSNKVKLRAPFGSNIWELTVTATRLDIFNLEFQAPPMPQQYSGQDWQLFLFTDDANYCDLGMTFAFYGDPSVNSIQPRNTILGGGTMVTVSGGNLDGVDKAQIVIKMTNHKPSGDDVTEFKGEPCDESTSTQIICTTPKVTLPGNNTSRRKRQTDNDMVNTVELEFEINVELDDDTFDPPASDNPGDCDGICVFQDPHVDQFSPLETECADRTHITIHGDRLNFGASKDDYNISVGSDGVCVVSSIGTNVIQCQPPSSRPDLIRDGSHRDGSPRVVVRVGNLVFLVGYLCYADSSINLALIGGAAGGGILLICIIACACCCCRRSGGSSSQQRPRVYKQDEYLNQAQTSRHRNQGYVNQGFRPNEQRRHHRHHRHHHRYY